MQKPSTAVNKRTTVVEPASLSEAPSEMTNSLVKEDQISSILTKTLRKTSQRVPDGMLGKVKAVCELLGKIEGYDKLQKSEIEDLRKQLDDRTRDGASAVVESQRYEKRIERMKDEYKKVIEEKINLSEEIELYRKMIEESAAQAQQARAQTEELSNKKNELERENHVQKRENLQQKEIIVESRKEMKELANKLRVEMEEHKSTAMEKDKAIGGLEQDILKLNVTIHSLNAKIKEAQAKAYRDLQALEIRNNDQVIKIEFKHAQEVEELKTKSGYAFSEMKEKLEQQLIEHHDQAKFHMESVVDRFEHQLGMEREKLASLKTVQENRYNDLQRTLTQQINDLEYKLKVLSEDKQDQLKALESKIQKIAQLEQEILFLSKTIEQLQVRLRETEFAMAKQKEELQQVIYYKRLDIAELESRLKETSKSYEKKIHSIIVKHENDHQAIVDSLKATLVSESLNEISVMKAKIVEMETSMERDKQKHQQDIQFAEAKLVRIREDAEKVLARVNEEHATKLAKINQRHEYELEKAEERSRFLVQETSKKFEIQLKSQQDRLVAERDKLAHRLSEEKKEELSRQQNLYEDKLRSLQNRLTKQLEEKTKEFAKKEQNLMKRLQTEKNAKATQKEELLKKVEALQEKVQSFTDLYYRATAKQKELEENVEEVKTAKEKQRLQFQSFIRKLETELVRVRQQYRKKEELLIEQLRKRIDKNNQEHKRGIDQLSAEQLKLQQDHEKLINQMRHEYAQVQSLYLSRPGRLEDLDQIYQLQAVVAELRQRQQKETGEKEKLRKELIMADRANRIFGQK